MSVRLCVLLCALLLPAALAYGGPFPPPPASAQRAEIDRLAQGFGVRCNKVPGNYLWNVTALQPAEKTSGLAAREQQWVRGLAVPAEGWTGKVTASKVEQQAGFIRFHYRVTYANGHETYPDYHLHTYHLQGTKAVRYIEASCQVH